MAPRGLWKLTVVQAKLFLREPPAFLFTLAFPVLMLLLFGAMFGTEPIPDTRFRAIDGMAPAFMGMVVATVALMGIPVATATARETGVLWRYRASPMRPLVYLVADVAVNLTMTALGVGLMVAVGGLVFGLNLGGSWWSVVAAGTLSALAFFAAGYLLAGLSPTARVAQAVGTVLFFPNLFLSGATIPLQGMPDNIQDLSRLVPLRYVVELLQGLWFGDPWRQHTGELAVIAGLLIVGTLASARTFRWQ